MFVVAGPLEQQRVLLALDFEASSWWLGPVERRRRKNIHPLYPQLGRCGRLAFLRRISAKQN